MNKLIYSVEEVFKEYLAGNKVYIIPAYQRGYKWDSNNINQLLADIDNFDNSEDEDKFYCLQNITLAANIDHTGYNVIDGQQRLTTLIIILAYLKHKSLIKGKLKYNIREKTREFLDKFIYGDGNILEFKDWDDFSSKNPHFDFQDIYYMFEAYKSTAEFFDGNQIEEEDFGKKLLNSVKIIINLPQLHDEQELFKNLNGGKVELDGADLVRATIITRIVRNWTSEITNDVKRLTLMNEQRVKLGMKLDEINRWWSEKTKKDYFSKFINTIKTVGNNRFDVDNYPINGLYKLYLLSKGEKEISLKYFEEHAKNETFVLDLLNFQRTMEDWYNDREIYHLVEYDIMYLKKNNENEYTFSDIYGLWKSLGRQSFINKLKGLIKEDEEIKSLLNTKDNSSEKEYSGGNTMLNVDNENWYLNPEGVIKVMILLDVIATLTPSLHLSFMTPESFTVKKDDIEHIFPQTPISGAGKKGIDKFKETIEMLLKESLSKKDEDKLENIKGKDIKRDSEEEIKKLCQEVNDIVRKYIPINSIGNLCLLNKSVNRAYGNDYFSEKRIDIMVKSHEGYFIRPHVLDAFNKVYLSREEHTTSVENMKRWDKDDIESRKDYIIRKIDEFLNPVKDEK